MDFYFIKVFEREHKKHFDGLVSLRVQYDISVLCLETAQMIVEFCREMQPIVQIKGLLRVHEDHQAVQIVQEVVFFAVGLCF